MVPWNSGLCSVKVCASTHKYIKRAKCVQVEVHAFFTHFTVL